MMSSTSSQQASAISSQESSTPTSAGWVQFAAVILLVNGIFSFIQGLAAVFKPETYYAVVEGDSFLFDLAGWGWLNQALGFLLIGTGLGLFADAGWARVMAIILAFGSSVVQIFLLPLQPWWAFIVISINMTIVCMVFLRGSEIREARRRS